MFGYVRVRKGDLRIKEFDFYKAVYCGLCHHQKKLSRRLRYGLSYDMVFLALLELGVREEHACFLKKRCPAHPVRPCLTVANSESLAHTAQVSAILLYYKLLDDVGDEKGFRRIAAKIMAKGAKKAMKHAPLPALEEIVKTALAELSSIEKAKTADVYVGADVFGRLLGEVFAFREHRDEKKRELMIIGHSLGRYIYILDAYADHEEDKKEGKYNPFLLSGYELSEEAFRDNLVTALDMEMLTASAALDRLMLADGGIEAILQNILRLGIGDTARRLILKNEPLSAVQKERDIL